MVLKERMIRLGKHYHLEVTGTTTDKPMWNRNLINPNFGTSEKKISKQN